MGVSAGQALNERFANAANASANGLRTLLSRVLHGEREGKPATKAGAIKFSGWPFDLSSLCGCGAVAGTSGYSEVRGSWSVS